jgi:undecaprenyl-diphosphatase
MRALLHKFDYSVTKKIQKWPSGVRGVMLIATLIGQPIFTVGIGAMVAGIGLGQVDTSLFEAGLIIIVTFGIGVLMKLLLRRDRPITEYVAHMRMATFSMPSGHAAGAVVAYGFLAYVGWTLFGQPWPWIAVGLGTALIILIGLSRIYLGAHYPSDVIIGWLLGALGLGFIIFAIQPTL